MLVFSLVMHCSISITFMTRVTVTDFTHHSFEPPIPWLVQHKDSYQNMHLYKNHIFLDVLYLKFHDGNGKKSTLALLKPDSNFNPRFFSRYWSVTVRTFWVVSYIHLATFWIRTSSHCLDTPLSLLVIELRLTFQISLLIELIYFQYLDLILQWFYGLHVLAFY